MDHTTAALAAAKAAKTCTTDYQKFRYVTAEMRDIPAHRVGVLHLAMRPRFVLADPTGVGKTNQALCAACYLIDKDPTLKLLVLTKASAVLQWLLSARRFTTLPALASGFNAAGDREISPAARHAQWAVPATIMVTSYQRAARDLDLILDYASRYILVLDEVHILRGAEDQEVLFPSAQRLSLKARYTWGLTATPMYTRPEDLYAVFEAVWPGFFGSSMAAFQERYLIRQKVDRYHWKTKGLRNTAELKARIEPYLLKRPAEEISKHLPAIVLETRPVVLDKTQRAFYNRILAGELPRSLTETQTLHKDAIWTYAQLAADIPSVLTTLPIPSAKAEALDDIVEEFRGQKLIVFSRFKLVIDALAKRLTDQRVPNATITGSVPALRRERNRQRFQSARSGLNVMLIDSAGGEALDLQAAGILVMFDLPWSWGELVQIVGRTRRIGSNHPSVLTLMLIAPTTTDAYVYHNLTFKESLTDALLHLSASDFIFSNSNTNTTPYSVATPSPDLLRSFSREEETHSTVLSVSSSDPSSPSDNGRADNASLPSQPGTVRHPASSSVKGAL